MSGRDSEALTRSQRAELRHIQRQSSFSDRPRSSEPRPASVEPSRPGSARASLTREPSTASLRRFSSLDHMSGAAEMSNFSSHGSSQSIARSGCTSASSTQPAQTIPAYNPLHGRSSLSHSDLGASSRIISHKSLGAGSSISGGSNSHSLSPGGFLSRTASAAPSARQPDMMPKSYHSAGPSPTQLSHRAKDSGRQGFLWGLEERKIANAASSGGHSQPRRSSSNPRALLELSQQYWSSIGSNFGNQIRR